MNIYVGNLSREADEDELKMLFEDFGEVRSAKIIKDPYSNESRGFAFVEMPDADKALNAIRALNSKRFHDRNLKVNEARPKNSSPRVYNSFSSNYGYRDRFRNF